MRIRYKRRRLRLYLIFGLLWLAFAIAQIFILKYEEKSWIQYGWFALSLMYLVMYSYEYFNQYLTLKDGVIKVNSLFGKEINLAEVIQIRKIAGDYILKTEHKQLAINTELIDPESLSELNAELEKFNIEWT